MYKAIEKVIKDLPENEAWWAGTESAKYLIPIEKFLTGLADRAELVLEETADFFEVDDFLMKLTGCKEDDIISDNSYNWGGNTSHCVNIKLVRMGDAEWVAYAIHRAGDVRCNYTDYVVMRFADMYERYDAISEVESECSFDLEVDGKTYNVRPCYGAEYYEVYGEDLNTEIYPNDITDEEMAKAIKEYIKDQDK